MQVAHVNDHITHAVIGGSDTIDFGISQSAEFFHILSSTLYKDQILAVVREVLCNAWDAHIEAGCTHQPVEITLTEDKFVIKDFGTGIHRNDMGLIYGTYGNSTKKNDGKQTGGFGLGCKAPFAYTDHFEVVSNNEGVKTIYNLSKSSAQAMGKPGIVPIASFPTKDTGLQVSIHINTRTDYLRFKRLIYRIAKNGDMNMVINGEPLAKLGFDVNKANYLITLDDDILDTKTPIMIRYGNVVYPVDWAAEFYAQYDAIQIHLKSLMVMKSEYRIIFQAPPHSISVTPSRETLSMQDHTIKTLKGLFEGFLATLDTEFKVACNEFAEAVVENAVVDVRVGDLLTTAESLPLKGDKTMPSQITDLLTMAQRYMESNYPKTLEFRKKDIEFRLRTMLKAGLLKRGVVQTFLHEMQKVTVQHHKQREQNNWLQQRIIGPLMSKLYAAGLDHDRLYVYDPADQNTPHNHYANLPALVSARSVSPGHLFATLPYLRNIIVLATSRKDLHERATKHSVFKELGKHSGYLFYQVGMKKTDRENVLKFFNATDMRIVDLTVKQDWELSAIARGHAIAAPPRKPAKKGAVSLKSVVYKQGISTQLSQSDDAPRILNPEFVIAVSVRQDISKDKIGSWEKNASRYVVDLYGDKGGITSNSAVHAKWIEKGAKEFDNYIMDKLAEAMMTNVNIQQYWAFHPNRALEAAGISIYSSNELVNLIYGNPALRAEFGIINNLTEDEVKIIHLWNEMMTHNRRFSYSESVIKAMVHLKTIPLDQANVVLFAKLKKNPLVNILDGDGLKTLLEEQKPNSIQVKKVVQILTLVLNN